MREQQPQDVVSVTTARRSHTEDIALRERRYVMMQMLRVACVLLGVLLPIPIWAKLLFFAGAVTLPWLGVVMANAGPTVERQKDTAIVDRPAEPLRIAIEPGRVVDAD